MTLFRETTNSNFSRREFLVLAGIGISSVAHAAPLRDGITAREVIERIQRTSVAGGRRPLTPSRLEIQTVVKGIATSFGTSLTFASVHAAGRTC
jgi:hypothetical protein